MRRRNFLNDAAEQLAVDYRCTPHDFFRSENKVTVSEYAQGQRRITEVPVYFRGVTMGRNAVMTVHPKLFDFADSIADSDGLRLFDGKGLAAINNELYRHGHYIGMIGQCYIPSADFAPPDMSGWHIEIFDEEQIKKQLYPYYSGYENALLYHSGVRKDVLAACAISGSTILGMAGASNDSDRFHQIGVDVLPEFRGKGLGPVLVSVLANELLSMGKIPYYETWPGNISSHRTAVKSGFVSAWTEIFSMELPK